MARSIGTGGKYATLSTTLQFDASGLDALSRDLMAAAEDLKRESRPVLAALGEKVMEDAKIIADRGRTKSGSNSVSGTFQSGLIDDGLTFRGTAGNEGNPVPGLWELGNKTKASATDNTFWHPIYGKGRQYQQRFPFFKPALKKNRYAISRDLYRLWDRVLSRHRLPPTGGGI